MRVHSKNWKVYSESERHSYDTYIWNLIMNISLTKLTALLNEERLLFEVPLVVIIF